MMNHRGIKATKDEGIGNARFRYKFFRKNKSPGFPDEENRGIKSNQKNNYLQQGRSGSGLETNSPPISKRPGDNCLSSSGRDLTPSYWCLN